MRPLMAGLSRTLGFLDLDGPPSASRTLSPALLLTPGLKCLLLHSLPEEVQFFRQTHTPHTSLQELGEWKGLHCRQLNTGSVIAQVHTIGARLASQASGGEIRRALSLALADLLDCLERLQGEYPLPQVGPASRPPPLACSLEKTKVQSVAAF